MPDDIEILISRLVGDAVVTTETLVTAALLAGASGELLARAGATAATTRDRQLVAIATAHLDGDEDRLDGFVRDHLAEHPDNILVAWIAAQHTDRKEAS